MSNESYANPQGPAIKQLVKEIGGRVWQSDIVDQTGLSDATISKALSELDSRGEIEIIELGRENLICLPGSTPEAYGPPKRYNNE